MDGPRHRQALRAEPGQARAHSREARRAWAIQKSREVSRVRADRAAGIGPEPEPEPKPDRTTIDDAITAYLDGARLSARTRTTYGLALDRLRGWATAEGVGHADELTPGKLASLRDWIVTAPKRAAAAGAKRGARKVSEQPRSPVTVNRELRTLGTVLGAWRRRELVSLTSDQIRDAMKRLPVERELPAYLAPSEIKKLLAAAMRHDAATFDATRDEHAAGFGPKRVAGPGSTPRYPAVAPLVAFLLLTGCRRGEALSLRWSDVDLEALDAGGATVGELRLRAADVKTRTARVVGLEVSPALRRMLSALRLKSGGKGRVFPDLTEDALKSARRRFVKDYAAPEFTWQALRSTCATYLVNAPGIFGAASAFLAARQLGHSVVVAERRYAGQLRGLPREARSLDAAMRCEGELAKLVASASTARGAPPKKRPRRVGGAA